jgi:excinuclease UvrABC nuclease subunit
MYNPEIFDICRENGNSGIYFFLDRDGTYMYIGKSKNLSSRIMSSFKERNKQKQLMFIQFMFMEYHNAHILEPYYILKYRPALNTDLTVDYEYDLLKIDHPFQMSEKYELAIDEYTRKFEWDNFEQKFDRGDDE